MLWNLPAREAQVVSKSRQRRGVFIAASAFLLLASVPAYNQSTSSSGGEMRDEHHAATPADRLEQASNLTEAVAGRAPEGPVAPVARKNVVDEFIFGKMERDGVPHAPLATDTEFFRRVHLDLTGRLPDVDELQAFVSSDGPDKREKLVDSIIDSPAYLAKWTYWFGDLARSAANRIGGPGKNLFYDWTYDSFHVNKPYNEMVEQMLTASATSNYYVGPASYLARWVIIGATCEEEVHEDTSDEIAVQTASHFLGLNLQCVSCHDGERHLEKVNLWLTEQDRADFWKQAAFFGKTRILRRTERSTARDEYSIDNEGPGYNLAGPSVNRVPRMDEGFVDPAFILTGEKPDPNKPPREEFSRMITSHPQFARATVNMFWAEMMGVGIVEPVGDFDLLRQDPDNPPPAPWTIQPSHPELLNALADDFREHNYDIQRLLRLIAASSAYQLSSKFPGEWDASYAKYYARKFARRLTAEEMHDAIVKATEVYTEIPIRGTDEEVRFATETRSPEDFIPFRDISFFLRVFGQMNRDYSERNNNGAIDQAILLMNSPFVKDKLGAKPNSFLANLLAKQPALSSEEMVEALYYQFLSRPPAEEEVAQAGQLLAENRQQGLEDLQWLLLNKVEFIFNY